MTDRDRYQALALEAQGDPDRYRAEVVRLAQRARALLGEIPGHLPRCTSPDGRCAAAATVLRVNAALENEQRPVVDHELLHRGLDLAEAHVRGAGGGS